MVLVLAALSQEPSFGTADPGGSIFEEIQVAVVAVQDFVADFKPDVVVAGAPDHCNGVLHSMMPTFAIGARRSKLRATKATMPRVDPPIRGTAIG